MFSLLDKNSIIINDLILFGSSKVQKCSNYTLLPDMQYKKLTTSVRKQPIFILMDRYKFLSHLFSLLKSKSFENREKIYEYQRLRQREREREREREKKKGK